MATQQNDMGSGPATERVPAQATSPIQAYQLDVERHGDLTSGVTIAFPTVRGGVCEYCGVIDANYPSEYQYKLCQHYRGKQLRCSYCPPNKNVDEVITHSNMRVLKHPTENKLIAYCDSYDCLRRHEQRWNTAATA